MTNKYKKHFSNRMKKKVVDNCIQDSIGVFDWDNNNCTQDSTCVFVFDWDNITFDVYDVLNAFNPENEQIRHAIKKLLVSGGRSGGKSKKQDLEEALWSLQEGIKELEG